MMPNSLIITNIKLSKTKEVMQPIDLQFTPKGMMIPVKTLRLIYT